jgi:hypothetical protein
MLKPKVGDVIYVKWLDSCVSDGWCHKSDHLETIRKMRVVIESVGYLIDQGEDFVLISAHRYEGTKFDDSHAPMAIPKRAILEWGVYPKDDK